MKRRTTYTIGLLYTVVAVAAACAHPRPKVSAELNRDASPVGNLPANPMHWKVVSSSIDSNRATMATLYGNDVAVAYARTHTEHNYPAGSTLSLVTWAQKEDPRWFGAQIPKRVQSVEFVFITATPENLPHYEYQQYTGSPLVKLSSDEGAAPNDRAVYVLSQRAAVLP